MMTVGARELTEEITTRATALLRRHPLRASDSVQLASCLFLADELGTSLRFVAFDDRLAGAAQAEGIECLMAGVSLGDSLRVAPFA